MKFLKVAIAVVAVVTPVALLQYPGDGGFGALLVPLLVSWFALLIVACWLVYSVAPSDSSRQYSWLFSAGVLASAIFLFAQWNIGLYHALMYCMLGAPVGIIFALTVIEVRARRRQRGSALGVLIGSVFCLGSVFPAGAIGWGYGGFGIDLYFAVVAACCYGGYRLGTFLHRRRDGTSGDRKVEWARQ